MSRTYGVIWRNDRGLVARGRLELGSSALRLVGRRATADVAEEIAYTDLGSVRVGRREGERIDGVRTVVVERCDGHSLAIAGLVEPPGLIAELAETLTSLHRSHGRRHLAIVVPLAAGSRAAAHALLAEGPPFDAAALGLDHHCVFVTDEEVVFVFEWRGESSVDALLVEPAIWERAAAWQELVAGAPRIADPAYLWARPASEVDGALLPPGLHA